MKLRSFLFSLVALSGFAFAASADTFATLNIQEIMRGSTAAKSLKEQLDAKQKVFQTEMSKKEEELQKEDQDLAKQRSVLSPDAFEKKAKDFKARANKAQKDAQAKRAELDDAFQTALTTIQKQIFDIVAGMAKDKGYTMVVPTSTLLYGDPKLDITQDVLTKLNSILPKVSVNFKAVSKSDDE